MCYYTYYIHTDATVEEELVDCKMTGCKMSSKYVPPRKEKE